MRSLYKDKVCFVTGAGSGIGAALTAELLRRGAIVIAADRDAAALDRLRIGLDAARLETVALDVTDAQQFSDRVHQAATDYGAIDALFNNAGILAVGEIRDLEAQTWRNVIETNLFGTINGIRAAYPLMIAQGSGCIVNVASAAALFASPLYAPYAASKAAVVSLSSALRSEARAFGIRVHVVCPGNIGTNIFDAAERANVARGDVFKQSGRGPLAPAAAAAAILDGVARDRDVIVFPLFVRVLRLLSVAVPFALDRLNAEILARFRVARIRR